MVEFNWSKSIFPLISCKFDKDGLPYDRAVLGTSFFATMEGYPLLISAKHVLRIFKDDTYTPCILTRYGSKPALKLSGAIVEHATMDFALMVLNQGFYKSYRDEFKPIHIKYEEMKLGQDIFTFGYPYAKEPPLNVPDENNRNRESSS